MRTFLAGLLLAAAGCDSEEAERCGPRSALVVRSIDGDTVELEGGERVRYLMIDTPEIFGDEPECYGPEAAEFNLDLVQGRVVELRYDEECRDRFGRLLAYVFVQGREVNTLLVERGFACVLHIPPNGADRLEEFQALEEAAKEAGSGLWGCEEVPC